jgi:tellurite resistance protein TehA-like permease
MGATAITVLAGARMLKLPPGLPVVPIPLLVALGLWRHIGRHWPLTYEPTLWSVVFPLGMYSVATSSFGKVAHLSFMAPISRFMLWIAVAAWAAVAVAFLARLGRRSSELASGAPAASTTES